MWYCIRPEFGIYSCWQPLFRLIIQTLTLNGESAEMSLEGTLTLTLDGGKRPPYNLSTDYNALTGIWTRKTIKIKFSLCSQLFAQFRRNVLIGRAHFRVNEEI